METASGRGGVRDGNLPDSWQVSSALQTIGRRYKLTFLSSCSYLKVGRVSTVSYICKGKNDGTDRSKVSPSQTPPPRIESKLVKFDYYPTYQLGGIPRKMQEGKGGEETCTYQRYVWFHNATMAWCCHNEILSSPLPSLDGVKALQNGDGIGNLPQRL